MQNDYIFMNKLAKMFHLWLKGILEFDALHFLRISQNSQTKACGLPCRKAFLRFTALLCVLSPVCARLRTKLSEKLPPKGQPLHFLYILVKLQTYANDSVYAIISSCDEKMYHKWCWRFIIALSRLSNVYY